MACTVLCVFGNGFCLDATPEASENTIAGSTSPNSNACSSCFKIKFNPVTPFSY